MTVKKTVTDGVLNSLSVIFIATNAQDFIEERLKTAKKLASAFTENVQLLVVDNGSTDKTATILAGLKKKNKKLEVITLRKAMDIGDAFLSSVAKVKGEFFFYTLADNQYNIKDLTTALKAVTKDVDVVNGLRTMPKKTVKSLKNNLKNQFIKKVFILPIKDINSDFKLIRTSLFKACFFRHIEKDFHKELMVKIKARKARFKEVEISYKPSENPIVDVDNIKESIGSFRSKIRFIDSVKLS